MQKDILWFVQLEGINMDGDKVFSSRECIAYTAEGAEEYATEIIPEEKEYWNYESGEESRTDVQPETIKAVSTVEA